MIAADPIADAYVAANATWCPPSAPVHHNLHTKYSPRWRDLLRHIYPALRSRNLALSSDEFDVYQYGVRGDESGVLPTLRHVFPSSRIFGFDTFSGMPHASEDEKVQVTEWAAGSYALRNRNATIAKLKAKLANPTAGGRGAEFVPGLFSESLTPELPKRLDMRPAAYVDIDCDLYESATTALDFLFAHRLIRPGTIIGYDDFWVLPCVTRDPHKDPTGAFASHPEKTGEWRAHIEMASRHKVKLRCIAGSCSPALAARPRACGLSNAFGPIFLVTSIGDGVDDGLSGDGRLTLDVINQIRDQWLPCIDRRRNHHVMSEAQIKANAG
jgi:hypothetical protein